MAAAYPRAYASSLSVSPIFADAISNGVTHAPFLLKKWNLRSRRGVRSLMLQWRWTQQRSGGRYAEATPPPPWPRRRTPSFLGEQVAELPPRVDSALFVRFSTSVLYIGRRRVSLSRRHFFLLLFYFPGKVVPMIRTCAHLLQPWPPLCWLLLLLQFWLASSL